MFCIANTALPGVALGAAEPADVSKNDVFVACYSDVRQYVHNSSVDLI